MDNPDLRPQLPDIFPQGQIRVSDERHTYQAYQGDGGKIIEEREYTLDKAPIDTIIEVTGLFDGGLYTFTNGTDYELSDDNNKIVWIDDSLSQSPDNGTTFTVTYNCDSIISRFLDVAEEEFTEVNSELIGSMESKFIGYEYPDRDPPENPYAEGKELDRLGKLFGKLGNREGRDDTQYRIYLNTIVESFKSTGTRNDIKEAVSVATNVPTEDITINENFDKTEYEIVVIPNTPVRGALLEEIADIADPSGVNQVRTRFAIDTEIIAADDVSSFRTDPEGEAIEAMASDDARSINANKTSLAPDETASDDTFAGTTRTDVAWDSGSWDDMNWAVENN